MAIDALAFKRSVDRDCVGARRKERNNLIRGMDGEGAA
jgi:hypothetical protein